MENENAQLEFPDYHKWKTDRVLNGASVVKEEVPIPEKLIAAGGKCSEAPINQEQEQSTKTEKLNVYLDIIFILVPYILAGMSTILLLFIFSMMLLGYLIGVDVGNPLREIVVLWVREAIMTVYFLICLVITCKENSYVSQGMWKVNELPFVSIPGIERRPSVIRIILKILYNIMWYLIIGIGSIILMTPFLA